MEIDDPFFSYNLPKKPLEKNRYRRYLYGQVDTDDEEEKNEDNTLDEDDGQDEKDEDDTKDKQDGHYGQDEDDEEDEEDEEDEDDEDDKRKFYIYIGCAGLAGFISIVFLAVLNATYCDRNECCSQRWIPNNITGLSVTLSKRIHGQHLVTGPILKHIRSHIEGSPSKPLVLSFHGSSGTGKNFVSLLIAEHLYALGMRSQYVHYFSVTKDFLHEDKMTEYKVRLQNEIEKAGQTCHQSMFIFDEFDKIPSGLIDVIMPYLRFHKQSSGVDYRRNIFLFLSNRGADDITKSVVVHYNKKLDRDQMKLRDMEQLITENNAIQQSELVKSSLITAFIPFLPLERRHVEKCIVDGLFAKDYYSTEYQIDWDIVRAIADELTYFPEKTKLLSTSGCKRVLDKIDLVVHK